MTLDVRGALKGGYERLTERNAAVLVGLVFALQLAATVANTSLAKQFLIRVLDWPELLAEMRARSDRPVPNFVEEGFPMALLDAAVPVLLTLALATFVAGLVVRMGVIRTLVSDETETVSPEHFTDDLVPTVLNLLAGAVLYGLVVTVGLALLVVPGVYLAVALFFYNYEIIVERKNVFEALSGSWELTDGERLPLFVLGLITVLLGVVVTFVLGLVVPVGTVAGSVVNTLVTAVLGVFTIAVAARAYNQLRGVENESGVDGFSGAPGPDELDEFVE